MSYKLSYPFHFLTSVAAAVLSVAQAAPRVEQVVCNPTNGGAIIRTWDAGLPFANGTGLSASSFFGATNSVVNGETTCVIPVAHAGNGIASMNQMIAAAAGQPGVTQVFIDYTNTTGVYTGATGNPRRFLLLADGLLPNGTTPQNRTDVPAGSAGALVVNNSSVVLRGNGEVRGNILVVGQDNEVSVNHGGNGEDFSAYRVVINGNIDASAASNGIKLNVQHTTVNGGFTGSAHDDTGMYGAGVVATGNVNAGAGNDTFLIQANAEVVGDIDAGSGDDRLLLQDSAKLTGKLLGGDGSDEMSIIGPNVSLAGISEINGGDGVSAADGMIDKLNLVGVQSSYQAENIKNVETILLRNQTNLTLTGSRLEIGNGVANASQLGLHIDDTSALRVSTALFTLDGGLSNAGKVDIRGANPGNTLLVTGNYVGGGGTFFINTTLGGDASASDKVVIQGDTSGQSYVDVTNAGGAGAQTVDGIKIVDVQGNSQGLFSLARPVQIGAWEYFLNKKISGDFYLESQLGEDITEGPDPEVIPPTPPSVYRPAVAGYTVAQTADFELGLATMGRLHQRLGEDDLRKYASCAACTSAGKTQARQAWGRLGAGVNDVLGRTQFNFEQKYSFAQVGTDVYSYSSADKQSQNTLGLMGSYGRGKTAAHYQKRTEGGLDSYTGDAKSNQWSVGAYFTHYARDAAYLDLVGQVSQIKNEYLDIYKLSANQKGYVYGLSAEVGKPYVLDNEKRWFIEPQAQLSYQYAKYKAFNDGISSVNAFKSENARARLGFRVYNYQNPNPNKDKPQSRYYLSANILGDMIQPSAVTLGSVNVSDSMSRRPWLELGVGAQWAISPKLDLYSNINYLRSIGPEKYRLGYYGSIGLRVRWE